MKRKDFKITQKQLEDVLGDDWEFFKTKILTNCYCHNCDQKGNATVKDYEIFANHSYDVIFKGLCKNCGANLIRYTETGEDEKKRKKLEEICGSISQ